MLETKYIKPILKERCEKYFSLAYAHQSKIGINKKLLYRLVLIFFLGCLRIKEDQRSHSVPMINFHFFSLFFYLYFVQCISIYCLRYCNSLWTIENLCFLLLRFERENRSGLYLSLSIKTMKYDQNVEMLCVGTYSKWILTLCIFLQIVQWTCVENCIIYNFFYSYS